MDFRRWGAGLLALAVSSWACGGDRRAADEGEGPETSISGLLPEPAEENSAAGEASACVDEQCPDLRLFGEPAPGCCRGNAGCGGLVQIGERTWLCAPRAYDQTTQALRDALAQHRGEPVTPDPSCPSRAIEDVTLAGCCGAGGSCGLNTSPWTAEAARYGLSIPTACVSLAEALAISGAPPEKTAPAQACGSGKAG